MRIASTQYHTTMNRALQDSSVTVGNIMQQMASGQRLLQPSDDPVSNVRISRLNRQEAALGQYRTNIAALKSRLQQNETHLDSMNKDMQEARDLLVWAADGSNTSSDVNAMASSLRSLKDALFYAVNAKDQEGRYLFSGTATATAAVTYNSAAALGARYSFTGNTVVQNVVVGNGVTQAANVSLPEMADMLNLLDRAVAVLEAPGVNVNDPVVQAEVTASLNGVDDAMNSVNSKIARLGGAQNILQTMDDNFANVSLSNKQSLIELGQLDYSEAAVNLNGYTTALQATQKAYGKISTLSLFNVL
ncbi:MAG: flgL [Rhodocyclaceae bacterium]|nr:flgL [Rhodocyclaceae bacterium]